MANTIKIKHGATVPNNTQLSDYELGYVHNNALYINNGGSITQLTDPKVINLINSNNYLQLPKIEKANFEIDKILVGNSQNEIYYKEPDQILQDIGALSLKGGIVDGEVIFDNIVTTNSSLIINNLLEVNGPIILKEGVHYGYINPNEGEIPGIKGQVYILLSE